MNTAGMYGDLQGIIGSSMPTIDGLSTTCIEFDDNEADIMAKATSLESQG